METFSDFSDLSWSLKLNFSRSKLHFPDLEVCYGWSTFLNPHFSRCLLRRICVTNQKNVYVEGYSTHTFDCFNLQ